MRNNGVGEREIVAARDGWPIPEIVGGAVVGAVLGLALVVIWQGPEWILVAGGASVGALLSYVFRPRRLTAVRVTAVAPEEHTARSRAA